MFSLAAQCSRGANADTQIDHLTWQHPAFKSDSWSELGQHKQRETGLKTTETAKMQTFSPLSQKSTTKSVLNNILIYPAYFLDTLQ